MRQWVGNSVVILAYPVEYKPGFRRGWQALFLWALVLASLGALGRRVGKWVCISGLFLQHLVHRDSAFLLLSGFYHHHPLPTSAPTKCLFPAPLTLSVGTELCREWWFPSEVQLIFRLSADWRLNLSIPRLQEPMGIVHCRSWFVHGPACPLLLPLLLFLPVGSLTCTMA